MCLGGASSSAATRIRGAAPRRLAEIRLQSRGPAEACRDRCRGGARGLRGVRLARRPRRSPPPPQEARAASTGPAVGRPDWPAAVFTQPSPNIYFFIFNSRRGPFADVRLRKAVNFAMDRRALALNTGLGERGRPTDQHIPPGLPGFEDAAIYPLGGPDLRDGAPARRAASCATRSSTPATSPACSRHGQILRSNLERDRDRPRGAEVPDPAAVRADAEGRTNPSTSPTRIGSSTTPTRSATSTSSSATEGFFHGPLDDPRVAGAGWTTWQASRASGGSGLRDARPRAGAEAAPAVPFATGSSTYFLSARVGCQVMHPIYGLDLAALCIRRD